MDECIGNACGMNAICLNTLGSFDCRCQEGFTGNPFIMCMEIDVQDDPCLMDPAACAPACSGVVCGPNAACDRGSCICLPGFHGDPSDKDDGCKSSDCSNDLDCDDDEICFSSNRRRTCEEACNKVECGPNAICVAQDHRSACLCKEGYDGNPYDPASGCESATDRDDDCDDDDECDDGKVCQVDLQGVRACVDPCFTHRCGQNEVCYVKEDRPLCRCEEGYLHNPVTNRCQSKYITVTHFTLISTLKIKAFC